MKNYAHILPFILLIISLVLMYIDNYFSGLTLYLMGIIYILIGSNELRQNSRKFNFYLIIGLFITTVTFLGEFVSGYIMLDTISIYEEVIKIKQSSNWALSLSARFVTAYNADYIFFTHHQRR